MTDRTLKPSLKNIFYPSSRYLDQIRGVSPANSSLHSTFIDLEPTTGTPVAMQVAFQANIIVEKDAAFPPLANLSQDRSVVPIIWAREGFTGLDGGGAALLRLAMVLPDAAAYGAPCLCLALACGALAAYVRRREKGGEDEAVGEELAVPATRLVTRQSAAVIVYDKVPFDEVVA